MDKISDIAREDTLLYPLTQVRHLDHPDIAPRLIRLPPRLAVLYAYATYLGYEGLDEDLNDPTIVKHLIFSSDEWVCGPFAAKENQHG